MNNDDSHLIEVCAKSEVECSEDAFIIFTLNFSFKSTDRLKTCPTLFIYFGNRMVGQVFNLSKLY